MTFKEILNEAHEAQIMKLYEAFFNAVAGAQDKENEINSAAERFRKGVDIAKRVLKKAREITG